MLDEKRALNHNAELDAIECTDESETSFLNDTSSTSSANGIAAETSAQNVESETFRPGAYSRSFGEREVRRQCSLTLLNYNQSVVRSLNADIYFDSRDERMSNASSECESNSARLSTELSDAQLNSRQEEEKDDEEECSAPVQAIAVNECDLEKIIRKQIINEAVEADIIHEEVVKEGEQPRSRRFCLCLLGLLTAIVIAVLLGLVLPLSPEHEYNLNDGYPITNTRTPESWRPTVERIRERGFLRCGVYPFEENVDWWVCEAVAAAVFGEPKVEYARGDESYNFERLRNHTIDLVASAGISWDRRAMRDIVFAAPPMFDGVGFSGLPDYVKCADDNLRNVQECSNLKICVPRGSSAVGLFQERLPGSQFVVMNTHQVVLESFVAGECNVIGSNSFARSEFVIRKLGYEGEFYFGKHFITKTPYSPASLAEDPEWANFINMVIQSLVVAEHLNITQDSAKMALETTKLFIGYENMFIDAITAVGNFGQAYQNAFPNGPPRGILEEWNDGTSGLMFSYDIGNPDVIGSGPVSGGILHRIIHRGSIRCGIYLRGPGFSQGHDGTYEGLDIEYCKALAASLFGGRINAVEYVELENETDGFVKISNGDIDVVAGAIWNLEYDVHEPTTGEGYTFSPPYFYGFNSSGGVNDAQMIQGGGDLCLLTSETDFQWSSFVDSIVLSLVYAEEKGVTIGLSNDMPEVYWFGNDFERIFRDAIFAVGNYGEVYQREVSRYISRGGRNMLNDFANSGPQLYVPPGLLQLKQK